MDKAFVTEPYVLDSVKLKRVTKWPQAQANYLALQI